ncbi:KAP family P-loop NTPase fold protein [Methanobacterium formicicum]|uniref:KAP NTPase domain-containing protein n=1 Tax=Methanobacterium formicicum TaxID=2162 RepID=A0A843AHB2_METFO|nr:P-loop NTPase fold protein [Methanobacterium formicicum]MBF4474149.1 hypothetical protein [Methanobacterium formicicum]
MKQNTKLKTDKYTELWVEGNDELGTNFFAEELCEFILNYDETESIVIGVCGDWGSGKTSIIKSTLNYIEKQQDNPYESRIEMLTNYFNKIFRKHESFDYIDEYIVIEFNPWNFSNQDQLLSQFFKEMAVKLGNTNYGDLKAIAQKIKLYASFFESASMGFSLVKAVKNFSMALEDYSNYKLNDLDKLKEELNTALKKQNRKIIIFIDDIDRLNKVEIRQIFQLVKSLADFPNTIYLLAFDKEIVINSLENIQKDLDGDLNKNNGSKYLEKIVQVILEIPKVSQSKISSILDSQLKNFTKNKKWDEELWSYHQRIGIKYFFRNIRDINRYYNTLLFNFKLLKDEVDIVDLFTITAFQVFIPEVYNAIRNNKDIFAGDSSDLLNSIYEDQQKKAEYQKFIENITQKRTDKISEENLMKLLKAMFPKVRSIYEDKDHQDVLNKYNNTYNKIYKLDMFDTYFRFSVPNEELSHKEFNDLIENSSKPQLFTNNLSNLINNQKIYKFFELVKYSDLDIPNENIKTIIIAIFNLSDSIYLNGDFGTEDSLYEVLTHLSSVLKKEDRFETFRNAIKISETLYGPVNIINTIDNFLDPESEDEFFSIKEINSFKQECAKKIKIWAEDNNLMKTEVPLFLLECWAEWGKKKDVQEFMNNLDEDNLLKIILYLSHRSMVLEDAVKTSLEIMKNIMDLNVLQKKLEKIITNPLVVDEKVRLFIKSLINSINNK